MRKERALRSRYPNSHKSVRAWAFTAGFDAAPSRVIMARSPPSFGPKDSVCRPPPLGVLGVLGGRCRCRAVPTSTIGESRVLVRSKDGISAEISRKAGKMVRGSDCRAGRKG